MPNCKNCGAPLTKGNIKVVRPRGKKRPYRIHRRCPEVTEVTALGDRRRSFAAVGNTAGTVVQRPQEGTGGPLVAEGVLEYSEPPRYRYFISQATYEKMIQAVKVGKVGITVEVIPVPEYQVDADPGALSDYIEVKMEGGMNHD